MTKDKRANDKEKVRENASLRLVYFRLDGSFCSATIGALLI
jgi:hypothetical protein